MVRGLFGFVLSSCQYSGRIDPFVERSVFMHPCLLTRACPCLSWDCLATDFFVYFGDCTSTHLAASKALRWTRHFVRVEAMQAIGYSCS